jgi:hypothetical protein
MSMWWAWSVRRFRSYQIPADESVLDGIPPRGKRLFQIISIADMAQ